MFLKKKDTPRKKHREGFVDVEIVTNMEHGIISEVRIDGHSLAKKICALHFEHEAGDVPKLTLTFIPEKIEIQSLDSVLIRKVDLKPNQLWE